MLLAIDTATRYASICLYSEHGILAEQTWRSDNRHSVQIMPAISAMLEQQKLKPESLKAIAVTKGPGSFTGLRIGMSIAKGLCLALQIPLIAIPTLEVTTYAVGDPGTHVVAVLEAGRGRLCVGTYLFVNGLPVQQRDIELITTSDWVLSANEPVLVTGEIDADLADRIASQADAENIAISSLAGSLRRAGYLAELAWDRFLDGRVDDLTAVSPVYIHFPASGMPE
jgi:tRNA threonylcarbamoyladenosine biosynthesis protein TsaB